MGLACARPTLPVRGAVNDVEPARDYESGRAAYQTTARTQIDEQLARLAPPASLAALTPDRS